MIELNRIYNEDCLEGMKRIPDGSVDLVVSDPPYLIQYKTGIRKNKSHKFCHTIMNDDNKGLITSYLKECYRILKENTAAYVFCSSKTFITFILLLAKDNSLNCFSSNNSSLFLATLKIVILTSSVCSKIDLANE